MKTKVFLALTPMLFTLAAAGADPAPTLNQAYAALRLRKFDDAIALFQRAAEMAPALPAIRKDLAYTLLKTGDTESARDQFHEAMTLDPTDTHVALEFAFLAYETNQKVEARRIFKKLADQRNSTAVQAFENVDRPLREGIARWKAALVELPNNFSGHEELARLAEQRDELDLAAREYLAAWRLKPTLRSLLVDLGRVYKELGKEEESRVVLLAASRGAEPRTAEQARELMPERYPYVYEFEKALELDPANIELRRELAYLHLQMQNKDAAEREFRTVTTAASDDLLSLAQLGFLLLAKQDMAAASPLLDRVLQGADDELSDRVRTALHLPKTLRRRPETPRAAVKVEARALAERSFEKGYMKDALKYLTIAHETDPLDFQVMLKLGWTNNMLKNDSEAVRWFELAGRSPDAKIASEAQRAYRNLKKSSEPITLSLWMYPMFSSRWNDAFAYTQAKASLRLPKTKITPYFSARLVGDARGGIRGQAVNALPQYLSESALILGAGVSAPLARGVTAWAEAGTALSYLDRKDIGRALADYRGGVSFGRTFGQSLIASHGGKFYEPNADAVYVSRFDNDLLFYSQNRFGYKFGSGESRDALHAQVFWSANLNSDVKHQYWANFVETGPGVRFRWASMPPSLSFSVMAMRGVYLRNAGNPRGPNFYDFRVGFWYAISR